MSSNIQVLSDFDVMNIAAELSCASEPEKMFRELLLFFIVDVNCSAG